MADVATGKVIVVGEPGVGKTSLIGRWNTNRFNANTKTTVGVDIAKIKRITNDGIINVNIWDIAGNDRHQSMMPLYVRDAVVVLVVYDMVNQKSFTSVKTWLDNVKLILPHDEPVKYYLVGNKCDLDTTLRPIFLDTYCKDTGFDKWYLVSAKTGKDVDALLDEIAKDIKEIWQVKTKEDTVKLDQTPEPSKCGC